MAVSHLGSVGVVFPQSPRARRKALAVGLSVAAHVAVGLILVRYSFIVTLPPPSAPEAIIQAQVMRYFPPTPAKTSPTPPQTPIEVRIPAPTPYTAPVTINVPPIVAPPAVDAGPVVLPTAPSGAASAGAGQGTAVAPAATPAPAKPPSIISRPSWLRQPTTGQMQVAYPVRALEAGVGGTTTINCAVLASGLVNDCQVALESPRGEGFGSAAIALSRFFMLNPKTEDGKVIDGSRVNIPMTFKPPTD